MASIKKKPNSIQYEWLCFKKYLFRTENIIFQINPNDSDFIHFDDIITNRRWSDTKYLGGKIKKIVIFDKGNGKIKSHKNTLYIYRCPFMLNKDMQSTIYMSYYINEISNLIRNNNPVSEILTHF